MLLQIIIVILFLKKIEFFPCVMLKLVPLDSYYFHFGNISKL